MNEPITKPKKQLSEAQLANLKKGREKALEKARAKKLEREKQKKEDEQILLKAKEEIKKVDIEPLSEVEEVITKQPEPDLITYDDDDDEEIEKPQPLLKKRNKKKQEVKEVKQTAKERLAEMRAKKKLELEEKKLQLEELKLNKQIEEQENEINSIKTKPKNSLCSTVPHHEPQPEVIFAPRRSRGFRR